MRKRAHPDATTPVGEHHEGSFGVYMRQKIARLQTQLNEEEHGGKLSGIFKNCVLFINGQTEDLTIETLRNIINRHGGQVDAYQTSRVTHVLSTHLPHTKVRQLVKQKLARGAAQQTPIVHPAWVVDSIEAGRLLPYPPYLVEGLRGRHGANIQSFLARGAGEADGSTPAEAQTIIQVRGEEEDDRVQCEDEGAGEGSGAAQAHSDGETPVKGAESGAATPLSGPRGSGRGGRLLSTKEDPHFIQNFYQQSRLHFIGRFRGQLQDEFAAQQGGRGRGATWGPQEGPRVVIHMDMDCFFVSVLTRDRPELQGKPVAVAHTGNTEGAASSEISSCNYEARRFGVHAGMWMGEAKQKCPQLSVLRYDFEAYEEVSRAIYAIFFQEADLVQPVSCDEAFLELRPGSDGAAAARRIRERIMAETRCPASAGVSCNMLLARIATKRAKPNGQCVLGLGEAQAYLEGLAVDELPGVGWAMSQQLEERGIKTCGQLRAYSLGQLQDWFGGKVGKRLHEACRGIDQRQLNTQNRRKSLGAEVNWGVRFSQGDQVHDFIGKLADEVASRLAAARVKGRTVTFHLKRSRYGPNEPPKLLGCGPCDNLSRSVTLPAATAAKEDIERVTRKLCQELAVAPELVRGLGIQLSKLEEVGGGADKQSAMLKAWLTKGPAARVEGQGGHAEIADWDEDEDEGEGEEAEGLEDASPVGRRRGAAASHVPGVAQAAPPPPPEPRLAAERNQGLDLTFSQIDSSVFEALPGDIQEELRRAATSNRLTRTRSTESAGEGALTDSAEENSRSPLGPKPGPRRVREATRRTRQLSMDQYQRLRSLAGQGRVDAEALHALPLGMRLDVAEHLTQYTNPRPHTPTQARPRSAAQLPRASPPGEPVHPVPPAPPLTVVRQAAPGSKLVHCFFAEEPPDEVRRAVLGWLAQIGEPARAHLELLGVYLLELLHSERDDELWALLLAFRRFAERRAGRWIEAYRAVLDDVQRAFVDQELGGEALYTQCVDAGACTMLQDLML